jgi:hypothetical protein
MMRRLEEGDDERGSRVGGSGRRGVDAGRGEPKGQLGRKGEGRRANEAEESKGYSRTLLVGLKQKKRKKGKEKERFWHF